MTSNKQKAGKRRVVRKEVTFMIGRGIGCTCSDCPVLYGGECLTGETPGETLFTEVVETDVSLPARKKQKGV